MEFAGSPAKRANSDPLPQEVVSLLWDCDPKAVSWPADQGFLSRRVLEHGGLEALRWLRSVVGDEGLGTVILASEGRGIDPRRLRYYELVLPLPRGQVNRWLRARKNDPWTNRLKPRTRG